MVDHADGRRIAQEIDAARRRRFPKTSVRSAATQAGISEGWWRQLVAGEQKRGDASFPVVGSEETYLAMARAVGVEADIAATLGRQVPPDADSRQARTTIDAIENDPHLLPEAKQHLLNQYQLLLRIVSPAPAADSQPSVEAPPDGASRQKASQARMGRLRTDVRGQQRPAKEQERGTGTQGDS